MTAGARALSSCGVVTSKEMQEVRRFQLCHTIGLALFVDQQRKGDARFFTKHSRVVAVAQSNSRKPCALVSKRLLVFAQLRDMISAKDSSIVPKKNQLGRLPRPQRAKTNFLPIAIGKGDLR